MTIFEVMRKTVDGTFENKSDIRPYVHDALEECFNDPESDDWETIIKKWKSYDNFVDAVLDEICSMDLDEDWLDGEVFSMMENTAIDMVEDAKQFKLETVWSTELNEYFDERYGIDLDKVICDAILEANWDENQKDKEKLKWT